MSKTPISPTLIHFTGKHLTPRNREKYLEHLRTIVSKGIRFNNPDEILVLSSEIIYPYLHDIICFTDIPLGMSQALADLYGELGFGFRRETIQSYGGNPVFYVPNGFVAKSKILEALALLFQQRGDYTHLLANFKMYGESTDKYRFLKEREWRLPYDDSLELKKAFVEAPEETRDAPGCNRRIIFKNPEYEVVFTEEDNIAAFNLKNLGTGEEKPLAITRQGRHQVRYFRFRPEDLELLILPDFPEFKEEVLEDPVIKDFFRPNFPPVYYLYEMKDL